MPTLIKNIDKNSWIEYDEVENTYMLKTTKFIELKYIMSNNKYRTYKDRYCLLHSNDTADWKKVDFESALAALKELDITEFILNEWYYFSRMIES